MCLIIHPLQIFLVVIHSSDKDDVSKFLFFDVSLILVTIRCFLFILFVFALCISVYPNNDITSVILLLLLLLLLFFILVNITPIYNLHPTLFNLSIISLMSVCCSVSFISNSAMRTLSSCCWRSTSCRAAAATVHIASFSS